MNEKSPFCLMPWIHFHVGDDGEAKACCVANIKYGNINTSSFQEIWNGKPISELRHKFANGISDKRCAHCLKQEASGATSIRQETHQKFKDTDISEIQKPVYFDIRFSNVCNLKCRTCWHGASSSWFEDAKKLKTNKGQKAVIKNISDFNHFIEKLGPSLLHAKEIYLAGGEPLVTEEHYLLLEWLIDNNCTHVKLRYNTNFTKLTYKGKSVLELWEKFSNVEILASLDASGIMASYIRTNSNWEEIVSNFQQVKNMPSITVKIAPTISNLNLEYLPELITDCIASEIITENDIYINILERPIHYNIQTFPEDKKEEIAEKIRHFTNNKSIFLNQQINEILTYLFAKDLSHLWSKHKIENNKLDELRNEKTPFV